MNKIKILYNDKLKCEFDGNSVVDVVTWGIQKLWECHNRLSDGVRNVDNRLIELERKIDDIQNQNDPPSKPED